MFLTKSKKMANYSVSVSSLFLALSLWAFLISPAHSLTCKSQNFTNNKLYKNCTDLPQLNSYLHFTYNASNSSLSIAFFSTPPKADGWVSWAINPTATGMIGSQAFIAFKSSNGSISVNTYNISSYSFAASKLSFDTWDLSAEAQNGSLVIFGNLKVPENLEKLNQVWQVGPVSNGVPMKHDMAAANKNSLGVLQLVSSATESPAPAPSPSGGGSGGSGSGGGGAAPTPEKAGGSRIGKNSIVGLVMGLVLLIGAF